MCLNVLNDVTSKKCRERFCQNNIFGFVVRKLMLEFSRNTYELLNFKWTARTCRGHRILRHEVFLQRKPVQQKMSRGRRKNQHEVYVGLPRQHVRAL